MVVLENNLLTKTISMKTTILILIFCVCGKLCFSQTANKNLNKFIYEWIDVPYKWGGNTKTGVDCSQLNKILHKEVYNQDIASTCKTQYISTQRVEKSELEEGDIVFFYSKSSPSKWHCGTYIGNGQFFHASNRITDVMISSLNEKYYARMFRGAGRVIKN